MEQEKIENMRICNQVDVLNTIAGRITNIVKDMGTEPCKLCEGLASYRGKCDDFSWNMTYYPSTDVYVQGTWHLSVYCHTEEIWFISKQGTVVDIILAAYEKLASGEWRKTAKDTSK